MPFNQNITDSDLSNMFGAMLSRSMKVAGGGDPFGQAVRSALPQFSSSEFAGSPYVNSTKDPAERQRRMEEMAKSYRDTAALNQAMAKQRGALDDLNKPFWKQY